MAPPQGRNHSIRSAPVKAARPLSMRPMTGSALLSRYYDRRSAMHKNSTNLMSLMMTLAWAVAASADDPVHARGPCRQGDHGRLIGYEKVASYPTADDARAHFQEW